MGNPFALVASLEKPQVQFSLPHLETGMHIAQLAYLNDAALWQAARSTMPHAQHDRLEALHDAQQRRPLTNRERAEEQALLTLYRETILVRAQAAVLLQQRGYNVADFTQFTLLE